MLERILTGAVVSVGYCAGMFFYELISGKRRYAQTTGESILVVGAIISTLFFLP